MIPRLSSLIGNLVESLAHVDQVQSHRRVRSRLEVRGFALVTLPDEVKFALNF